MILTMTIYKTVGKIHDLWIYTQVAFFTETGLLNRTYIFIFKIIFSLLKIFYFFNCFSCGGTPQMPLCALFLSSGKLSHMKNLRCFGRLKPTAVRGKWFETNDLNHLSMDTSLKIFHKLKFYFIFYIVK